MRLLVILSIVLMAFIGLGIWSNHALTSTAEEFSNEIDNVVLATEQHQWDDASKKTRELRKEWNKQAAWWPIILDHQEIDNIEFTLVKIEEYIKNNNIELSLAHLAELKLMIKNIPENEAVTIKNIL